MSGMFFWDAMYICAIQPSCVYYTAPELSTYWSWYVVFQRRRRKRKHNYLQTNLLTSVLSQRIKHVGTTWTSSHYYYYYCCCCCCYNILAVICSCCCCCWQTNLPVFRVKESSVRRRYSDFEWLRAELERDSKVRRQFLCLLFTVVWWHNGPYDQRLLVLND